MLDKFIELMSHYVKLGEKETSFLKGKLPIIFYKKNETIFSEEEFPKPYSVR